MKTNDKDILATRSELRQQPYGVPEGYFDSFKAEMSGKLPQADAGPWKKSMPYVAAAASLALMISAGALALGGFQSEDTLSQEDYILFSDNLISTDIYEDPSAYQVADAELLDDEIIEYLIYTGVSPEIIELSK